MEKKYRSSWFTVQVLIMSHFITFHSVYFELSTVPKRETIEGSRPLQSSSVFSLCLIWLPRKKSQKISKNRTKSIRLIVIFPQMNYRFKVGLSILERTWILSGIQFTTHFIEFFVVEAKQFVSRFVHVILARQTCGQRSSKAAESKRRALGNYFPSEFAICS